MNGIVRSFVVRLTRAKHFSFSLSRLALLRYKNEMFLYKEKIMVSTGLHCKPHCGNEFIKFSFQYRTFECKLSHWIGKRGLWLGYIILAAFKFNIIQKMLCGSYLLTPQKPTNSLPVFENENGGILKSPTSSQVNTTR